MLNGIIVDGWNSHTNKFCNKVYCEIVAVMGHVRYDSLSHLQDFLGSMKLNYDLCKALNTSLR